MKEASSERRVVRDDVVAAEGVYVPSLRNGGIKLLVRGPSDGRGPVCVDGCHKCVVGLELSDSLAISRSGGC